MAATRMPEMIVAAPQQTVLRRGAGAVQLGLDPSAGVQIGGLCEALTCMLLELAAPVRTAELIERYATLGVDPARARALLRLLVERGAVVDARAVGRVVAGRRGAVVVVHGDGPLASGVAVALAAAGVGSVYLSAARTGMAAAPAVREAAVREAAVREGAVREAAPGPVRTGPPPPQLLPDLAVLTDAPVPDPRVCAALLAAGVPHLAVRLRDGWGVVGPMVLPGRTSCLGCLELYRSARDPAWPLLAAQLAAGGSAAGSACPAGVAAVAGLAAVQALTALDGLVGGSPAGPAAERPPPIVDATLDLDPRSGVLLRRPLPAHPDCSCHTAAPHPIDSDYADRPVQETIEA